MTCCLVLKRFLVGSLLCSLLGVFCFGCAPVSGVYSTGEAAMEDSAAGNYELAMAALAVNDYLLAREYFNKAVVTAVSQQLYQDSLAGLERTNLLIKGQR